MLKNATMIQILIFIQSWSVLPRTRLQPDDTACGIETTGFNDCLYISVFNSLQPDDTACGIETLRNPKNPQIEEFEKGCNRMIPLAVLKLTIAFPDPAYQSIVATG